MDLIYSKNSADAGTLVPESPILTAQSERMEAVLPVIARHLFTAAPDQDLPDLPLAQLRLCLFLLDIRPEQPTLSRIAEEFGISASAATQLADRLERAGLAERIRLCGVAAEGEARDADRRARCLRLTERGSRLVFERQEKRLRSVRQALERLSPAERERVVAGIELLLTASHQAAI